MSACVYIKTRGLRFTPVYTHNVRDDGGGGGGGGKGRGEGEMQLDPS